MVRRGIVAGLVADVAGVAVTAVEQLAQLEQALTERPGSCLPGRSLGRLLHLPAPDADRFAGHHAVHRGTGASVGARRA